MLSSWHCPAIDMINDVIEHSQYKKRQYNALRSVIYVTKKKKGRGRRGREGQREASKMTCNRQAVIGTEG